MIDFGNSEAQLCVKDSKEAGRSGESHLEMIESSTAAAKSANPDKEEQSNNNEEAEEVARQRNISRVRVAISSLIFALRNAFMISRSNHVDNVNKNQLIQDLKKANNSKKRQKKKAKIVKSQSGKKIFLFGSGAKNGSNIGLSFYGPKILLTIHT